MKLETPEASSTARPRISARVPGDGLVAVVQTWRRLGMDKVVATPGEAVCDIGNGASIGIAGFGVAHRFPSSLIMALCDKGSTGLTVYCNGLGQPGHPTAHMLADNHQISRLVTCFSARPGVVSEAERQIQAGQMSLEMAPQGTLVERMRAGGAGARRSTPRPATARPWRTCPGSCSAPPRWM